MEIFTDRLLLREFSADDIPAYAAYRQDPRYGTFYRSDECTPEFSRRIVGWCLDWAAESPRVNYQLAICLREKPQVVVGGCGLRARGQKPGVAEFGLELAPAQWGRGLASEATRTLLSFGFETLSLLEVRGLSVSANDRVAGLVQRLGFVKAASHSDDLWLQERGWSRTEWLLTRDLATWL